MWEMLVFRNVEAGCGAVAENTVMSMGSFAQLSEAYKWALLPKSGVMPTPSVRIRSSTRSQGLSINHIERSKRFETGFSSGYIGVGSPWRAEM